MLQVLAERDEARANRNRLAHELAAVRAEVAQLRRTRPDRDHARRLEAAEGALAAVRALLPDECWEETCIACQIRAALATPTTTDTTTEGDRA